MTQSIEIPESLAGLVGPIRELIGLAARQVAIGARGLGGDYEKFSGVLEGAAREVERVTHQLALAALDVDAPRVLINGVVHDRVGRHPGTYRTKAGAVVVPRSLYRPRGTRAGKAVDAISLRAGVVGDGWLPDTAKVMAHRLQQETGREAEETGRQMGRVQYSRSSYDEVGHLVGRRLVERHQEIEQVLIERYEVPAEATGLGVSLDRVALRMEEPRPRPRGRPRAGAPKNPAACVYRMAFCATVTLHDKNGDALHTIRYGTMPNGDPDGLCVGLAGDVLSLLSQRSDLSVTLLCDGAPEMWNRLDAEFTADLFPEVHRLVDFFHLLEKLSPAATVLAGDADAGREMLRGWKARLKNTNLAADAILRELRASNMDHVKVGQSRPVHEAITYLENHAPLLRYASALRAGRPIGSGAVEATCKSLVSVRMKRPGARWKTSTGENILHLRAMALSDRWDDALKLVLPTPAAKIRAAA